jgi:hypothetical protein
MIVRSVSRQRTKHGNLAAHKSCTYHFDPEAVPVIVYNLTDDLGQDGASMFFRCVGFTVAAFLALTFVASTRAEDGVSSAANATRSVEAAKRPLPRAKGQKCAVLRGQTGTDYYCASSVLRPQADNSYGVDHLFSNSSSEAWVEGRPGQGVGEWIVIDFREFRQVRAVIVRNGYQKSADTFSKNSRVQKLRLAFSQGESQTLTLQDNMELQKIAIDPAIGAYWVQFIIDDVYPGSAHADAALTKLWLTSDPVR